MLIEQNMEIKQKKMMKINSSFKNFATAIIVLDLCLVLYSFVFQSNNWLLNTQVAFFSSLFVTIATFLSYRRNVQKRISNLDASEIAKTQDRDKIDQIDDPFDLYSEEVEQIPEEELTPEKIKEIIKDEKSKVKRNSLKNTIFSAGGFVSFYRIAGYGSLILGFFALNNNKIFLPIAFMIGLAVVPVGVLLSNLLNKKN